MSNRSPRRTGVETAEKPGLPPETVGSLQYTAVRRIQRSDRFAHPDDKLASSARGNNDWRTPRGRFTQRSPNFTPGRKIESDHARSRSSADGKDEQVVIDQRRRIERTGRQLIFRH